METDYVSYFRKSSLTTREDLQRDHDGDTGIKRIQCPYGRMLRRNLNEMNKRQSNFIGSHSNEDGSNSNIAGSTPY